MTHRTFRPHAFVGHIISYMLPTFWDGRQHGGDDESRVVVAQALIPALERQRQMDLYKFKASLNLQSEFRTAKATQIFNVFSKVIC
jgi:hypothetical protein